MGLKEVDWLFLSRNGQRITIRLSDRQILAFLEWSIGDCSLLDRTQLCCARDCCPSQRACLVEAVIPIKFVEG